MPTPSIRDDDIPGPAFALGAAGLLPFVFGALAIILAAALDNALLPDATYFARVLMAYGAVILSFLGGVRWGAAIVAERDGHESDSVEDSNALTAELVVAVLPSLIAWGSLLMPPPLGLALLAISFVVMGIIDQIAAGAGRLPRWYGRLRIWLSIGATTSIMTGLVAYVFA